VNPQVAEVLLGPAHQAQIELSQELGREIEIRARPGLHQEQFEVVALDEGPPVSLSLRWLEDRKPEEEAAAPPSPETDEEGAETAAPIAEVAETIEAAPAMEVAGVMEAAPATEVAEAAPPDPAGAETLSPQGEGAGGDAEAAAELPEADPGEGPAEAEKHFVAIAAPVAEMLDAEAESPILPASDEREES
jgi:hypothetical protein